MVLVPSTSVSSSALESSPLADSVLTVSGCLPFLVRVYFDKLQLSDIFNGGRFWNGPFRECSLYVFYVIPNHQGYIYLTICQSFMSISIQIYKSLYPTSFIGPYLVLFCDGGFVACRSPCPVLGVSRCPIFGRCRFWGCDMIFNNGDVDGRCRYGDFHCLN